MNPITDFNAAEFLTFYALLILVVWATHRGSIWRSDRTLDEPWTPPVLADINDVAYLRGGAKELARVAAVQLAERGFLEVHSYAVEQAPSHPDPATLPALERRIFDFFKVERTPGEVNTGLLAEVNSYVLPYEERLQSQQLFAPETAIKAARLNAALGIAVIALVGITRLIVAVERHRPAGFLIAMAIAGMVLVGLTRVGRLSRRGRAYLRSLKRDTADTASTTPLALATALFGGSALAGSPHESLQHMFAKRKASDASSAGGCGGGDGGCGGGGCGGCGGCGG